MTNDGANFRERLLAAQAQDAELKHRYEQEIHNMLEHKLSKAQRWVLVLVMAVLLVLAAIAAVNLSRGATQARPAQDVVLCLLVFGLAAAGWLMWVVVRGVFQVGGHGLTLGLLIGCFSLCTAAILVDVIPEVSQDRQLKTMAALAAIVVIGWAPMAIMAISYYHYRTREKLLEIQYQLAALAEEIRRK